MNRLRRAPSVLRESGVRSFLVDLRRQCVRSLRTSRPGVRYRGWRYRRLADGAGSDRPRTWRVDPARVDRVVGGLVETEPGGYHLERVEGFDPEEVGLGAVLGGDWDVETPPVTALSEHDALRARIEEDRPWSETDLYDRHRRRIEAGAESYACESLDELDERFASVDRLIESLATDGYRPAAERGDDPFHEPRIAVGRDGRLLYSDEGRHRLLAARLLGVDQISAYVVARHEEAMRP